MKKVFENPIFRSLFGILCALPLAGLAEPAEAARISSQLVECSSTTWSATTCGEDQLTSGGIVLRDSGAITVTINEALADPYNLYEVFWLPIGEAASAAVSLGQFATDCNGDARAILRTITTPREIRTGAVSNIYSLVGNLSAGSFLVLSRGPWAVDSNHDCTVEYFNTTPLGLDRGNPLANPTVTPASDLLQFISGYQN